MQALSFQLLREQPPTAYYFFTICRTFMLSVALRLQITKDVILNFLKQIHSIHLFYTIYNFSEYFWGFFRKKLQKLELLLGKVLGKNHFSSKVCLLRKKIITCLKLGKPGLNQPSSGKLATTLDNSVVRKQNTGSLQH